MLGALEQQQTPLYVLLVFSPCVVPNILSSGKDPSFISCILLRWGPLKIKVTLRTLERQGMI